MPTTLPDAAAVPAAIPRRTRKVELDAGPPDHRMGLLTFDTDIIVERDFQLMSRALDGVALYSGKLRNADEVTIENLRALGDLLPEASQRLARGSRLDALVYACTSGTIVLGYDEVRRRLQSFRPGVPVVTPITAVTRAFETLGVRRVAMLSPYVPSVEDVVLRHLRQTGIEVLESTSFDLATDEAMGRVPPNAIVEAACAHVPPGADAVFVSCTSLRTVEVVETIERRCGIPVVASTQALFWDALRSAGCRVQVPGFGRLLASAKTSGPRA
jgi:maleate isomerase